MKPEPNRSKVTGSGTLVTAVAERFGPNWPNALKVASGKSRPAVGELVNRRDPNVNPDASVGALVEVRTGSPVVKSAPITYEPGARTSGTPSA